MCSRGSICMLALMDQLPATFICWQGVEGCGYRKLWFQIHVLVQGERMAASFCFYLLFSWNRSGGEPGPKEAAITETVPKKYVGEIYFTGKHKTQKAWVTVTAWGVFYFPPPTHSCIKYGSTITLSSDSQNLHFPPSDWTFPGEFRPGMCSWWRSNCNSWEENHFLMSSTET